MGGGERWRGEADPDAGAWANGRRGDLEAAADRLGALCTGSQPDVALQRRPAHPVGVVRGQAGDELIQVPANRILTTWEDGVRLMEQSVEERMSEMAADPTISSASLVTRV